MHVGGFTALLATPGAVPGGFSSDPIPWKGWDGRKALPAQVTGCLLCSAEPICCVSSSTVVAPTVIKALTVFP